MALIQKSPLLYPFCREDFRERLFSIEKLYPMLNIKTAIKPNSASSLSPKTRSQHLILVGVLVKKYGAFKRARGRFSITTGKLVEKDDGKKYYEVYPELYEHEQACIISSALQMIKQSEKTNPSDSNALFTS
jgi:hypothetical protein